MTPEEIDAHLWSIGIGSDARGLRVLLVGTVRGDEYDDDPLINDFKERLEQHLGAECVEPWQSEKGVIGGYPLRSCDAAVVTSSGLAEYEVGALLPAHLKPEARYLVVIDELATGVDEGYGTTELTSVTQVGGDCVRITGYRPRRGGE